MQINEDEIRARIRRNLEELDSSLLDGRVPENAGREDESRIREITERIVSEETERHFTAKGLVKYISSTGRVYWLTPEQRDRRLRARQKRRSKRKKKLPHTINRKKALAIGFFMLCVVLVVWILFETGVFTIPQR